MRRRAARAIGGCLVLLAALSLSGPPAWADNGRDQADRLCAKADAAERDAREFERKSEERRRFLKGRDGIAVGTRPAPAADTTAGRQSARAQIAQARAMLAQLRQQAAASENDRNVVPGFGRWFLQLEGGINRSLLALESCLDRPESCNIPPIACPAPPAPPSFSNVGSAAFVRNVQQSYQQAANASRQACQKMNAEFQREGDRLRREGRAAATPSAAPSASAEGSRFGDTDLYLVRVESLKRDAARYRQEATRLSGVANYCSGPRTRPRIDPARARDVADAVGSAGKRGRKPKPDPAIKPAGTVVDLKAGWEADWNGDKAIAPSVVPPLPRVSVWRDGEEEPRWVNEDPPEDEPSWREKTKEAYRKADEDFELTEFIQSRPKELRNDILKEIVSEYVPFGDTLVTGYEILSAVHETTVEIGEILQDAPAVLASNDEAAAQELADRAHQVPVFFMYKMFGDEIDKLPPPRRKFQYKERIAR